VITAAGTRRFVRLGAMDFMLERAAAGRRKSGGAEAGGLEAPMPGVVTKVLVAQGDRVQRGQPLVAVEAMKMEHMVRAPRDGQVKAVRVKQGELVGGGAALLELEETGAS
jgi:3-methylcrotonyl-CoA carboxylase alpha subunit